jgi:polyisoprenoid-binding protein YceI
MKRSLFTALLLSFVLIGHADAKSKTQTYTVDSDHSSVDFKIRHLVGKVKGNFNKFEGKLELDADKIEKMKSTAVIDATSIDTNIQKRDDHLRSADFFETEKFKTITFTGEKVTDITEAEGEIKGKIHGKITIKGVTKPLVMDMVMHGKPAQDPWGNMRVAISASGMLNRKDFGLNWNKAIETGGFVVGDDVEIAIETEAFYKAPEVKKDVKKEDKTTK